MEPPFDKLDGVLATTSGYIGGTKADPTYEQVTSGRTGHYEALQVDYDPARVSYERLLEVFWRNIDPSDATGQFCDKGPQYRSAIFVVDDQQRALAEASKAALEKSGKLPGRDRDRDPAGRDSSIRPRPITRTTTARTRRPTPTTAGTAAATAGWNGCGASRATQ